MPFKEKLRYFFVDNKNRFIGATIGGFAAVLLFLILKNGWINLIVYSDSFLTAGGILFCVSGFSFVNYHGGFDMFSYSFSRKKRKEMKEDYYQYCERKTLERKGNKTAPLPYIIVGFGFIIISIIFYLIILSIIN